MKKRLNHYMHVWFSMKTKQSDVMARLLLPAGAMLVGLLMRRSDVPLSGSIGMIAICLGLPYFLLFALATYAEYMDTKKRLQEANTGKCVIAPSTGKR
jgi:hypothetical protein